MTIIRYCARNAFDDSKMAILLQSLQRLSPKILSLTAAKCYYIEVNDDKSTGELQQEVCLCEPHECTFEIGPVFNSANAVTIYPSITGLKRLKVSIKFVCHVNAALTSEDVNNIFNTLGDMMAQFRYPANEKRPVQKESWYKMVTKINGDLGLPFDDQDLQFYTDIFQNVLHRTPNMVEIYDCAHSNSDRSRRWLFHGKLAIDGTEQTKFLIKMFVGTHTQLEEYLGDTEQTIVGEDAPTLQPMPTNEIWSLYEAELAAEEQLHKLYETEASLHMGPDEYEQEAWRWSWDQEDGDSPNPFHDPLSMNVRYNPEF